jgi:hypothetical protein
LVFFGCDITTLFNENAGATDRKKLEPRPGTDMGVFTAQPGIARSKLQWQAK